MNRNPTKTQKLVECAMLVALGFALSYIKYEFPYGGSITPASMLPVLLIGVRHGPGWGLCSGLAYGLLQALQGNAFAPPASGIGTYILMLLLDYILAFTVLGFSGLLRGKKNALTLSVPICTGLRYACHVTSGILLWGSYAWEGWPVVPYSFVYNLLYLLPDAAIAFAAALFVNRYLSKYLGIK